MTDKHIEKVLRAIAAAPTTGPYEAGQATIGADGVDGLFEWFSGVGASGAAHAERLVLSANLMAAALDEIRTLRARANGLLDRIAEKDAAIDGLTTAIADGSVERDRLSAKLAAVTEVLSQRYAQIGAIRAPAIAGISEADVVAAGYLCSDPQLSDHTVAARLSMPWRRFLVRSLSELCTERMEVVALRANRVELREALRVVIDVGREALADTAEHLAPMHQVLDEASKLVDEGVENVVATRAEIAEMISSLVQRQSDEAIAFDADCVNTDYGSGAEGVRELALDLRDARAVLRSIAVAIGGDRSIAKRRI